MRRVSWGFVDNTVILHFIKTTFKRRQAEEENGRQLDSTGLFHGSPALVVEMELPALC
jgi:hypothetical protein